MFHEIFVAVDGSAAANRGLKTAIDLAADQQARLHIVHVIDNVATIPMMEAVYLSAQYTEQMTEALRRAGRKVLAKAEAMAATRDIEVGSALVEAAGNTTAHAILAQARKKRADLIVMGTHGRRGLSRALMGSDAEMVVREARVPVLLVRSPERPAAHSRRSKERTAGPAVRSGGNSHKAARPAS